MTLIADRVFETTLTTGTGTLSLAGAAANHRAFRDAFPTGAPVLYVISQVGTGWETGLGTLTHSTPDTLSRDTVLGSSNAGLGVNFTGGASAKDVFCGPPGAFLAGAAISNKGPTRPAWAQPGTMWVDDSVSPWIVNFYDGTDDIPTGQVDQTANEYTPFFNGAALVIPDPAESLATAPPEISMGTDALNDIDVAAKACRDDLNTFNMPAGVALGKQIDGAWTEGGTPGTPAGGYAGSAALANDFWYHFFKIAKPDGTVDAGFDDSPTAVNLLAAATGYTKYRRLNSVRRLTGANKPFIQIGDNTLWTTPLLDISAATRSTGSSTLRTLMCPPDFRTEVEFNWQNNLAQSGGTTYMYFRTPDTADLAPSNTAAPLHTHDFNTGNAFTTHGAGGRERIITNTSRQIAERASTAGTISYSTIAYTDRRGRDG